MTEDYGTATWRYRQEIRNAVCALSSYQDRPPMPVRSRVEWECGGVQGLDGAIFVELKDRRYSTLGVWLHPDDVWWEGKM